MNNKSLDYKQIVLWKNVKIRFGAGVIDFDQLLCLTNEWMTAKVND